MSPKEAIADSSLNERLSFVGKQKSASGSVLHDGGWFIFLLLSNSEWMTCRVKCGRKPGEANA